jgi:tetratricopeptide (TPR) repeat protein
MRMRLRFLLLVLLLVSSLKAQWTHVPPADLYQKLSLPQRSALDKALALYARGGEGKNRDQQLLHKTAATEWERFRVQHGTEIPQELLAYSIFMQAMSQRASMDRHTALKTFTEALDLYPDVVWLAAPALYFRGLTYLDIGDETKALTDFREMTEDPAYRKHALAADAFNRVAENHWVNKRPRDAVRLWEEVSSTFGKVHRDATQHANNRLLDWKLVQGDIPAALDLLIARENQGTEQERRLNAARRLYETTQSNVNNHWSTWYYKPVLGDKKAEAEQTRILNAVREWFSGLEGEYTKAGRRWEFLMLRYDELARGDAKKLDAFVPQVLRVLRESEAGDVNVQRVKQFIDKLASTGRHDTAMTLLELIPDAADRLWTDYGLQSRRKSWKSALLVLDQIDALKTADHTKRSRQERARIYHRELGQYEDAIKLYHEINDPPATLWEITDCYRRWGKKEEAQNTLTEMASIFPDQASRAVFAKAEYFRHDGEKAKAIGFYRNLLSHPEWRKSREASQAHDRLEDMGIETGGAVVHEVN